MIPENIEALQKESLIRIVDDDAEIRETLSLMLEIEGWRTCAYPGAQEFLVNDQPSTVSYTHLTLPTIRLV